MQKIYIPILLISLSFYSMLVLAEETAVNISDGWNLTQWQKKVFSNTTEYKVVNLDSQKVLKASTDNSASILYKQIEIDLTKTPYLNWSWRVENVYSMLDPKSKQGDDFPARVYVVFNEGILPWEALSLNYIWANAKEKDEYWPNPFTDQAMMIPVQSGKQGLGQWQYYKKDIRKDFLRTFNKSISKIHGIAIMADSDNAMEKAISYFGDITFSSY